MFAASIFWFSRCSVCFTGNLISNQSPRINFQSKHARIFTEDSGQIFVLLQSWRKYTKSTFNGLDDINYLDFKQIEK